MSSDQGALAFEDPAPSPPPEPPDPEPEPDPDDPLPDPPDPPSAPDITPPSAMSTFRVDLVGHLNTVMGAFITANPTIIRRYWRARPGSFAELPTAFMDSVREDTVVLDNGTWQRQLVTSIVIVDAYSDNEQVNARFHIAVDALRTWLVRATYADVGGGIITLGGTTDIDSDIVVQPNPERLPVTYRSAPISIVGIIQEGRPS